MKEIHCYIFGRVQGVGYRAWCVREATKLSLTGWVRNRSDGSVEVFAKGPVKVVDLFLSLCREGPLFARVRAIEPVKYSTALVDCVEEGMFKQKATV